MKTLFGRLVYKFGYALYYSKWFIFRPKTFGVQIIVRNGNNILFIQHTYMHKGLWDFPGGGVKENESPIEAARRETEEELKISNIELREIGKVEVYHSYHHDHINIFTGNTDSAETHFNKVEIKNGEWFPLNKLPTNLSKHTNEVLGVYLRSL